MCENLLKKKLEELKFNTTKEENIVENAMIFLERDANGIRKEQHWENVLFSFRYLHVYKKWLFLIRSPYYKETETTVFSLCMKNDVVVLDSSFEIEEKKYKVEETFYNNLADAFLAMVKTDEFVELKGIFDDLVNKDFFDLTVFLGEYKHYSPNNLYIKVNSNFFKELIDATTGMPRNGTFSVVCDETSLVHQPFLLSDYVGKYGEINGFRIVCMDVNNNALLFQFV